MKVQASLREVYQSRKPLVEALKAQVDGTISAGKPPRWHYESRIKELESFAVKVESGRFADPAELEDFLACTIVVPNSALIDEAITWIRSKFEIRSRRPRSSAETWKRADAFPFDDLRLYCARGNDGSRRDEAIDHITFEIQVKTFLQHAWGIATHDLSYKTDDVRWGKDRIVAHLKAAIEFAEVSIQQAEQLSHSPALQVTNSHTKATSDIIIVLSENWQREELPANLRGLAQTLQTLLDDIGMNSAQLSQLLTNEKARTGQLPINLSPYGVILQLLLNNHQSAIERMLTNRKSRTNLLLTPEISVPLSFRAGAYAGRVIELR